MGINFKFLFMSKRVRNEEFAPLGEFMLESFKKDQVEIESRFPVLDVAYLNRFEGQLGRVKGLESTLIFDTDEKTVTRDLYAEADGLSKELNYLSVYFKDSGFETKSITVLKEHLADRNIEGALLELTGVSQYAKVNSGVLVSKGMKATFPDDLDAIYASMTAKNVLQNSIMDARKTLVDANSADYDLLYDFVSDVGKKGKIIFEGTRRADAYTISKIIKRLRAPARKDGEE